MGDVADVDIETSDVTSQSQINNWTIAASSISELPSSRVMLLPARIDSTGPANVGQFMTGEPHLTTSLQFRGRDLKAEKIELNNQLTGLVVKKSIDESDQSQFTVTNKFDSLYLLHRGATLSDRADVRHAIVEWPKFASALHSD